MKRISAEIVSTLRRAIIVRDPKVLPDYPVIPPAKELARTLGKGAVSAAPLNEAIYQLAARGIINRFPRQVTMVRIVSTSDIVQMLSALVVLQFGLMRRLALTPKALVEIEKSSTALNKIIEAGREEVGETATTALFRCWEAEMEFHLRMYQLVRMECQAEYFKLVWEQLAVACFSYMHWEQFSARSAYRERIIEALRQGQLPFQDVAANIVSLASLRPNEVNEVEIQLGLQLQT